MTPARPSPLFPGMAVLMFILLCLIWGSTWLAIKIGLTDAPPLATAAIRFLVALFILTGLVVVRRRPYPRQIRTIVRLGYPGVYMYGCSYAFVYLAEQHISSALTAVLFGSFPFFVAFLSWVRYRAERLIPAAWVGLAVGLAGVVLISYDSLRVSGDLLLGTVLAVGGAFAAAYGVVIHKRYHAGRDIVVAAHIQMIFGGVLLILASLLFENIGDFSPTLATVGSIVYLAVIGTVVAFLAYYWLLARIRAVSLSLIAFVSPLVAILLGVVVAGETLSPVIVVGTLFILSGIILVVRK